MINLNLTLDLKEDSEYSIKVLRTMRGETQEETAKAIGVSTQTYCAWEKDISKVAISKVKALAVHFGVRLSQIYVP